MRCLCFAGCFNLPCVRDEYPVKKDPPVLSLEEVWCVKYDLLVFSSEDLSRFTDQFSPENLIGATQFGKLYRGKMSIGFDQDEVTKDVVVKIVGDDDLWCLIEGDLPMSGDQLPRLEAELKLLLAPTSRSHPNLVKVIGCCFEDETVAVVYDLNPRDTLYNLITQDDFKWLQRVKTALALARLLNHLHDTNPPCLIRNFDPAHVVADQNLSPILIEFGMLVGGVLGNTIDRSERRLCNPPYLDPSIVETGPVSWTVKSDVYAFGILLLNLITKRVFNEETDCSQLESVTWWAMKEYMPGCSLVLQSLKDDPDYYPRDGLEITKLAMQCIDREQENRPEMKQVVERLQALRGCAAW